MSRLPRLPAGLTWDRWDDDVDGWLSGSLCGILFDVRKSIAVFIVFFFIVFLLECFKVLFFLLWVFFGSFFLIFRFSV